MMPVMNFSAPWAKSFCGLLCLLVALALTPPALAETLDEAAAQDNFLEPIAAALDAFGVDVAANLNDRQLARGRVGRPRLGRFPDLPLNNYASSRELQDWESAYVDGEIAALAVLLVEGEAELNKQDFLDRWLDSGPLQRFFVTYHRDDSETAEHIHYVLANYGFVSINLEAGPDLSLAGNLYSTASQRLAIDSQAARRYRGEPTEMAYLGERVRRGSNSLFRDGAGDRSLARREPSIFLKESLGDEFSESTIREIIVPGGVALGETAYLNRTIAEMRYGETGFSLQDEQAQTWQLPDLEPATLKALFDFVQRSEAIQSDAIVDIDEESRVRISSALRDTDAGYEIMHADTLPFEYVSNLSVIKSVIIDVGVDWFAQEGQQLGFATNYEVRFLSADNMRLAQTRVALEYEYESATDMATHVDAWGRDVPRLRESLDYAGLGEDTKKIAEYAAWIGLLRKLHEEQVPFLHGRYQFMKLDKSGRQTPTRY